jgi:eukaryotic-like serine/threonine-protein kinase
MTNAAAQCPPADVISAFAFGELSAANASFVQAHVSVCDSCLQTVGQLAASVSRQSHSPSLTNGAGPADASVVAVPGQQIGQYRLVRSLGEGGMGEVWLAEQSAPVRRTVALKLLKAGMDTRQILARFEAERQALAMMQHPGIAQVFDAGATPAGRPYFVMEYVDGVRISRCCDDSRMTVPERVQLFAQVCDAVQHAHQKGIIHRDIKPSNVLVSRQGELPLPKVIDFGLAKLTAENRTDVTLTEVGTLLGTPAYASPEQLTPGVIDVDTRSDVYSLGALLYELLVGVLPFELERAGPDSLLELRSRIRMREPVRPSVRIAALGSARAGEIAGLRGVEPVALRRQLRGDLDWIVMKALEKDRTRRYNSPAELAQDLQRFLRHQPVMAGPPNAAYRVRKFVRRNWLGTAFASTLLALVVAFAIVSAVQVKRVRAERDRASAEAAKASSINRFLQDTLGSADPWQTGADISVRETLQRASQQVDSSFKNQPLVAAAVRRTLGKTYVGLGRLDDGERQIRAALDARIKLLGHDNADVAESLADLANLYRERADYVAAIKTNAEALALRRKLLGNGSPVVAETLVDRAAMLKEHGDYAEADRAGREALTIRERLFGPDSDEVAGVLEELGLIAAGGLGDLSRGEKLVMRGYDIQRRLYGPDDLRTAAAASNLGSVYLYQGKNDLAEKYYRIATEGEVRHLGKSHPFAIAEAENLANALARLKRFDESLVLMKDVLAERRAVLGEDSPKVARTMINTATLLSVSGHLDEAESIYSEAIPRLSRAYGAEHPDVLHTLYAFGMLKMRQHQYSVAERLFRQALSGQVKVLPADHTAIADTRLALGKALTELKQFAEADTVLIQARTVFEKAYGNDGADTRASATALDKLRAARGD